MKGKVIFEEEQMFRYTWSYWLVLACSAPIISGALYALFNQFVLGEPFGSKPMSDTTLIILSAVTVVILSSVIWLFHYMKLRVFIDAGHLRYSFYPFVHQERTLSASDLENLEVTKYEPITAYGGWGYRWSLRNGRAINVTGNIGLQIIFKNGKKLLLGTQKPKELKQAVKTLQDNWRSQHG